jgi:hypothetical protein
MPGGLGKKGFRDLAAKVAREYERKGYSRKRAEDIGRRTAGKVEHEKREASEGSQNREAGET